MAFRGTLDGRKGKDSTVVCLTTHEKINLRLVNEISGRPLYTDNRSSFIFHVVLRIAALLMQCDTPNRNLHLSKGLP